MLIEADGMAAVASGYNVLAFEGPGQGLTVRLDQYLTFRYDWEVVVEQVAAYAQTLPSVNGTEFILWGESFGGYFFFIITLFC